MDCFAPALSPGTLRNDGAGLFPDGAPHREDKDGFRKFFPTGSNGDDNLAKCPRNRIFKYNLR
jgi:hypothetical protein